MIPKKIETAMNEQVQKEFASAYLYLSMSAWADANSWPGMAAWLRAQWEEEIAHGMKFYSFITDRGGRVELKSLEAPESKFSSPLDIFERALDNEQKVTASINDLYELAQNQKDFASYPLLDWFASEQVEEESSVGQIVDDLRRVGDSGEALLLIDHRLSTRSAGDHGH